MVVLLTALIVTFFSRAALEQKISHNTANQIKADLFARGAVDCIVSGFKQEIEANSSGTIIGGVKLYDPLTVSNRMPSRDSLGDLKDSPDFANLVAMSSASGGALSTGTSLNGHTMSMARWNQPLLLPASHASDLTPPIADSQAPRWISVTRNGDADGEVVGRYAYMVYNEGGLLDANVAGGVAPAGGGTLTMKWGRKGSAAFADLSVIGLSVSDVTQLVGWRNYATVRPRQEFPAFNFNDEEWTRYFDFAAGRVTVSGSLYHGQSNQRFCSRQQLIRFMSDGIADGDRAVLRDVLQYLGTFSRSLNQPHYYPNAGRPRIISGAANEGNYSGGNNAQNSDGARDKPEGGCNPVFQAVRVSGAFTRNDGSTAAAGEPLVKKRFALSRLLWLTYRGASAKLNADDELFNEYVKAGLSREEVERLRREGTEENIKKYFGLTGMTGANGDYYWRYTGVGGELLNGISTLEEVRNAGREPNFFELLKAGITAGAVGKAGNVPFPPEGDGLNELMRASSQVDNQLIQIGANIIDQSQPDNFPTRIVFNDGAAIKSFWGVVDLPYWYGYDLAYILTRQANPPAALGSWGADTAASASTLTDAGQVAGLLLPMVWNPHRTPPVTVSVPNSLRPAGNLRVCISNRTPLGTSSWDTTPRGYKDQPNSTVSAPWENSGTVDAATGVINMSGNTAVKFKLDSSGTLFREPTVLMRPGSLGSSNPSIEADNVITSGNLSWVNGVKEHGTGERFIGFYLGKWALRYYDSGDKKIHTLYRPKRVKSADANRFGFVVSLEYQSGSGWVPYQQVPLLINSMRDDAGDNGNEVSVAYNYQANSAIPFERGFLDNWMIFDGSAEQKNADGQTMKYIHQGVAYAWDPRSTRWPMFGGSMYRGDFLDSSKTTVATYNAGMEGELEWRQRLFAKISTNRGIEAGVSKPPPSAVVGTNNGYLVDPDGVNRGSMGYYTGTNQPASTTVGLPMAPSMQYVNSRSGKKYQPNVTAEQQIESRPMILHRPFRTVAELGYVFSDTPWRNLDFFTTKSGNSALLDVFCVNDADAVEIGRVDLNTRQAPVLAALLSGAYRDEWNGGNATPLSSGEALTVANKLLARTGTAPLGNLAELVGYYVSGSGLNAVYDGFSADLAPGNSTAANDVIQRYREAPIRALSSAGQAGTWNLLIDVVAQIGRYPGGSGASPDDFFVEGERRYWVHIAIDRQTGKIIDNQIEEVGQ
jgi:hypothetical protein